MNVEAHHDGSRTGIRADAAELALWDRDDTLDTVVECLHSSGTAETSGADR